MLMYLDGDVVDLGEGLLEACGLPAEERHGLAEHIGRFLPAVS
jgi:hypothetical protein